METGILLESGTNELEILEFKVGNNHYGINVAKIKEILPYQVPTPIPNSHPCIEGIFMPRDEIISIINLEKCLNLNSTGDTASDMYIVTNFNKLNTAFHVHGVTGIQRVSWADIAKPDATINAEDAGVATGIIRLQDKLIVILDFEKIVSDISPETGLKTSDIEKMGTRERNNSPILIAEDSALLSKLISDCLFKAGYNNLITTSNGAEAWEKLCGYRDAGIIDKEVSCIITDIEMPQMDGHRLTKLVKDDPDLQHIPVVIFSSLVNEEMRKKGESLGANAQLSKPEIGQLVEAIDKLIIKKNEQ
ncbi:chemotaxis protein [Velocimicrobium porci]|uniref:Stage 0 sporulation protein A homolog n=1 Tax=Velocimicrobium porci TaxID=2606634 RepID=A0A6L5XXF2_9FIRM|nr:chemotaxis protein [Velocimicrobium porci]MSS63279.1 chemotaxis protein CheV [Velocimicrobium porci]